MHQLDIDVALRHTDDGFTVRLRSGNDTWLSQVAPADPERMGDRSARAQETTALFVLAAGPGQASGGAAGNEGAS
jgi:hypothetical protein